MEKKITRTLVIAEVSVKLYNRDTGMTDTENIELVDPGKNLLKAARQVCESEVQSVVDVSLVRVIGKRYSMPLELFLSQAEVEELGLEEETA